MKKSKLNFIYLFLFFNLIFVFLLSNSYNYLDPDLGWHLRVGQEIFENKSVPHIEHNNYTLSGKKWVDHEWLLNLLSFFLYNNFGYLSLSLFFVLIMMTVYALLFYFTKNIYPQKNTPIAFSVFGLFGLLAMAPHLGVRMQEITILNLLILLIIVFKYDKNNDKSKNNKILFWLLPLFIFWANVHAGFLIGLCILFFYLTAKISELFLRRFRFFAFFDFSNPKTLKEILVFLSFIGLSFLATLINPYGIGLYDFLKSYGNTFYLQVVVEWLPLFKHPFLYHQILYTAAAMTIFGLHFFNAYSESKTGKPEKPPTKIKLWYFSLSLLFFFLAQKSRRHFPLFFIISFPLLIEFVALNFTLPKKNQNWLKNNFFVNTYAIIGLILASMFFILTYRPVSDPFQSKYFCEKYPCAAIDFLKNNDDYKNLKLFNNYSWGGYSLWVWPEKNLFLDGRLPIYEINGHSLLEEYNDFFKENKSEAMLAKYEIETVMLSKKKPITYNWFEKNIFALKENKINSRENHLKNFLSSSVNWKLAYEDKVALIYVKNKK